MGLNKCDTCEHSKNPDGGHCYMFKEEPPFECMQHTKFKKDGYYGCKKPQLDPAKLMALLGALRG